MADEHGLVIEDIRQRIAPGQEVYDLDGDRVGFVDQFDLDAGWMTVGRGGPVPKEVYIPFSAISGIDPREIYLSLTTDALRRDYASPPPRTTVVEGGETEAMAITTEPSGYDGTPVVVDRVSFDTLRNRIELGMRVYAADGAEVGTVKRYNPATGWMLVETGLFTPPDLAGPASEVSTSHDLGAPLPDVFTPHELHVPALEVFTHRDLRVPLTVVTSVVGDTREVYLSVNTTDLQRIQHAEHVAVAFDDKRRDMR